MDKFITVCPNMFFIVKITTSLNLPYQLMHKVVKLNLELWKKMFVNIAK